MTTLNMNEFEKCPYCETIYTLKGLNIHVFKQHQKEAFEDMKKLFKKLSYKEQTILRIVGGNKWVKF